MPEENKVPEFELEGGVHWLINKVKELESKSSGPVLVGIAGATASGKTSRVAGALKEAFKEGAIVISMDDYYMGLKYVKKHRLNFERPESINRSLLVEHLRLLKAGKQIKRPKYSRMTSETEWDAEPLDPRRVMIIDGLFALNDDLVDSYDLRVFVEVGIHGRVVRRLMRDFPKESTGWALLNNFKYMLQVAEPMYYKYTAPTRKNADVIINNDYNPHKEAAKSMLHESQMKFKSNLGDDDLVRIGAERLLSAMQTDYFYVPPDGSFSKTGELLRIRKEQRKIVITYKGPQSSAGDSMDRHRFEFEIDRATEKMLPSVYELLPVSISRCRTLYLLKGAVIALDTEVTRQEAGKSTDLGNFVLIKVPEGRRQDVGGLRAILQLGDQTLVNKTYLEMY